MPAPTHDKQTTILVVDDQPFFVSMMQNLLQSQGYRVVAASNGDEGLALAKKHKPDAILLDIEMPGKNGFVVCQALKQDADLKHIPVIILTATQDTKLNEKAFRAGATITATKSMAGERLLNTLSMTLKQAKPPAV
ncbi:MAG TPA: response regulator [Candidatus Methylomirabilis sp.]|nr:response regulator [Candidatus Methylomirabilis sp.]